MSYSGEANSPSWTMFGLVLIKFMQKRRVIPDNFLEQIIQQMEVLRYTFPEYCYAR